jgi:hypothetical protein
MAPWFSIPHWLLSSKHLDFPWHHEESPTHDGYHSSELSEVHGLLHLGISFVEESHHQQVSVSVEYDEVTVAFSAFQGKSRCLDDRSQ